MAWNIQQENDIYRHAIGKSNTDSVTHFQGKYLQTCLSSDNRLNVEADMGKAKYQQELYSQE